MESKTAPQGIVNFINEEVPPPPPKAGPKPYQMKPKKSRRQKGEEKNFEAPPPMGANADNKTKEKQMKRIKKKLQKVNKKLKNNKKQRKQLISKRESLNNELERLCLKGFEHNYEIVKIFSKSNKKFQSFFDTFKVKIINPRAIIDIDILLLEIGLKVIKEKGLQNGDKIRWILNHES